MGFNDDEIFVFCSTLILYCVPTRGMGLGGWQAPYHRNYPPNQCVIGAIYNEKPPKKKYRFVSEAEHQ